MNDAGPSGLELIEHPIRLAAMWRFGGETLDPREHAEADSAFLVRFQREGLRAVEATVLNRKDHLLIGDGFAVLAEQFVSIVSIELRKMAVVRRLSAINPVDVPRPRCAEV